VTGQRLHIVGLGRSGVAAALLAAARGYRVSATDAKGPGDIPEAGRLQAAGVELDLGGHDRARFLEADLVVVSPGVGPLVELREAEEAGVPVISEIEFASRYFVSRIAAVTGTNGKSTVTSMIAAILEKTGMPVWAGGNLGTALSSAVDAEANRPEGWIVLELSSFQLERVAAFRPHVAVILNLTPDHFDRYASFDEYAKAKCNIFRNQGNGDHLILPADDPRLAGLCRAAASTLHRVGGPDGDIVFDGRHVRMKDGTLIEPEACNLRNTLYVHNAMFAMLAAGLAGAGPEAMEAGLRAFAPLRHRYQLVAESQGVQWINDSKATNPESAVKALETAEQNVILLAGGLGKGLDFAPLADGVRGRVKAALLFGRSAGEIRRVIEGIVPVEEAGSLAGAVERAAELARAGDTVLLAPGCASFDMFKNFEDRGDQFMALVRRIVEHGHL
jgi:UDP-N-acetylmuramoylalanine--D-glutamate ligase